MIKQQHQPLIQSSALRRDAGSATNTITASFFTSAGEHPGTAECLNAAPRDPARGERKSGAPPTTNSFGSSAEETSGATRSRAAQEKHKSLQMKDERGEQKRRER